MWKFCDFFQHNQLRLRSIVYTGTEPDIAWIVQGLRHISGIRKWPSYQQAQILVKFIEEKKIRIREAANIFGIKPKDATRQVKAWYGFLQAKNDEDYGLDLKPEHFVFFDEVIFVKLVIQNWLKWNDDTNRFENTPNLTVLLSWIIKDPEKAEARISTSQQLRDVVAPAMSNHPELFKRWENDETMSIEKLNYERGKLSASSVAEWLDKVEDFNLEMKKIPAIVIEENKEKFKACKKQTRKSKMRSLL
jgi:hypothetical protein